MTGIRILWMGPLWLAQLVTGYRSFADNPILGSPRLNRLGLHALRVRWAHGLARWRRRGLTHLADAADREAYEWQGFVMKPDFLPKADFAAVRAELLALTAPVREMVQGDTVTRRLALDADRLKQLPHTRALIESPALQGIIRYVASFDVEPVFYVQTILNQVTEAQPDPQTALHSDTFHPSAKAWLFLTDVAADAGPFVYVPGSHRLTRRRLAWERRQSVDVLRRKDNRLSARGSLRIAKEDLPCLRLPSAQAFAVSAGTLVVADTYGFHARGPSVGPSLRIEIWAYARRSPFLPFRGLDIWRLPVLRHRKVPLFWRVMDRFEQWGGRRNPWRKAGTKPVADQETLIGRLPLADPKA